MLPIFAFINIQMNDKPWKQWLQSNFYNSFHIYRIGVDEWLRVPSVEDVFSIGDCSGFLESTGKQTLPALAQVSCEQ